MLCGNIAHGSGVSTDKYGDKAGLNIMLFLEIFNVGLQFFPDLFSNFIAAYNLGAHLILLFLYIRALKYADHFPPLYVNIDPPVRGIRGCSRHKAYRSCSRDDKSGAFIR